MIKYRLTDAKKNKNIIVGDGLADIFKMVLPYAKNILPKLATTVGLSSIGALTSNAINKKKKDTIIKLTDSQVKKINDNLKKINDSKIFNKQITLAESRRKWNFFVFITNYSIYVTIFIIKRKRNTK